MKNTDVALELISSCGGYLTSTEAATHGIKNVTLQRMTNSGQLERIARGLYVLPDVIPDPFIVAQHRCPKGVFSHETALFLHDLSDRVPLRPMMTIPNGWNSKMLKDGEVLFFYSKTSWMELGVCKVTLPSELAVWAFNKERTLCDCLRSIEKLDRDLVVSALKKYAKSPERDNAKLIEYADTLNIRDLVYRYMEVLI
ncbi:MAG: type IV toxin-antitoxin system AbiEi family antitoxin domain-containing protein [Clostridiales Family XIII bacterium]|nr:type IV toxin-antitoxin system AbiEi family antitoxin domain-containing protein [Clostridiales Family XIII bacterium]